MEVMRSFGGLHRFMGWNGPILTDSGGFQVFSLAKLRKITEEGVHFQNHLDGAPCFIGPETAMDIQAALGSDIAMVFDECPPHPCGHDTPQRALALPLRWAERCRRWAAGARAAAGAFRHRAGVGFRGSAAGKRRSAGADGFRGLCHRRRQRRRNREEMMQAVDGASPSCLRTSRATRWAWAPRRR